MSRVCTTCFCRRRFASSRRRPREWTSVCSCASIAPAYEPSAESMMFSGAVLGAPHCRNNCIYGASPKYALLKGGGLKIGLKIVLNFR